MKLLHNEPFLPLGVDIAATHSALQPIRTCVERMLPAEQAQCCACSTAPSGSLSRVALAQTKIWQPAGRTLRVRFLDGHPAVQHKVMRFAQEWSNHANLHFAFGSDPNAELRVSFTRPGSWSYIGTDALAVPQAEPTINLGWLTPATPNDEVMRIVLHEFGHAIGLIHEHQNPAAAIPWNRAVVYAYYGGPPNYWTREQVDSNLFARYASESTQFSAFDPTSIMLYPIPPEFTHDNFTVGWNCGLSAMDKAYVAAWYP